MSNKTVSLAKKVGLLDDVANWEELLNALGAKVNVTQLMEFEAAEEQQAEDVAAEEMRHYITTDMARHDQQCQVLTEQNIMHYNFQKCREGHM